MSDPLADLEYREWLGVQVFRADLADLGLPDVLHSTR